MQYDIIFLKHTIAQKDIKEIKNMKLFAGPKPSPPGTGGSNPGGGHGGHPRG